MSNLPFDDLEYKQFTRRELNEHDYPDENGVFPSLYELKRRVIEARQRIEAEAENKMYRDLALAF